MKNYKAILGVAALSTVIAGVAAGNALAWGDSDNGRQAYTVDQINNGVLGNKVVLNSITDNPVVGDERYFVQAREDGTNNTWNASSLAVEDGKTYVVRMYIHNNSPLGYDAPTSGLAAKVTLPKTSGTGLTIDGSVRADNATPKEVWDEIKFTSDSEFHLEFISGSARWEIKGGAAGAISDKLVNGGVYLGYDKASDGMLPGCFGYSGFVTFKVKAVADQDFTLEKKVRLLSEAEAGRKTWYDAVKANDGDTVEYRITYTNTSKGTEKDVQIYEKMGSNLQYVPGTTMLYNANHPNGVKISSDDLTTSGLNIGDYTAGSNAVIIFKAKIVNGLTAKFGCGADNTLRNTAAARIGKNTTTKTDFADVVVHPECPKDETPTPTPTPEPVTPVPTPTPTPVTPTSTPTVLPSTGAGSIVASVLGAGSVVTSAGAYFISRKKRA